MPAAICLILLVLAGGRAMALEAPLAGFAVIGANSPRSLVLAPLLEQSIVRVIDTTAIFKPVNPSLLREELLKYGCTDEGCLIRFARDAGLSVMIRADFDDQSDYCILTFTAYGLDLPYQNRIACRTVTRIPLHGRYTADEYSRMMDEQAGIFFSRFLYGFQAPVYNSGSAGEKAIWSRPVSGWFDVYRLREDPAAASPRSFVKIGRVRLSAGVAEGEAKIQRGDFVLVRYVEAARLLESLTYGKKREMVFRPSSLSETVYAALLAGPASAVMPLAAPIAGYYRSNDWGGAALWFFNTAPYLYLEISGLADYFSNYYKKKRTIPADARGRFVFGWYFMCAGGVSLMVDSLAYGMIQKAADYQGVQPFLGNPVTAGFLALIAGGAGHFYRGLRLWGYLYFHTDNMLLYFTIREFTPAKRFNIFTQRFETARIVKPRAYSLLAAALAVKAGEVIHAVLARDTIMGGTTIEQGFSVEPVCFTDETAGQVWGIQAAWRF